MNKVGRVGSLVDICNVDRIYENDTLKFVNTEEGRIIMTGASPEYQYQLKNHLGNVRTMFTTKQSVDVYSATFENATQASEMAQFQHYTRVTNDLYDHTDAGTAYDKVQLLNGSNNLQVGLAKSLSVMAGHTVKAEVYAKYFATPGATSNLTAFASALLAAFGLPAPVNGEVYTAASALKSFGAAIAGGVIPENNSKLARICNRDRVVHRERLVGILPVSGDPVRVEG